MEPEKRRWHVHLDTSEGGILAGWAWDETNPNEVVVLEITSTTDDSLTYAADGYRPDLEELGYGNGKHAFHIDISNWDLTGQMVRIRAVGDDEGKSVKLVHYNLAHEFTRQPWIASYNTLILPLIRMTSTS